ncbi:MAG TPA: hypothetical protein VL860_00860 [Planctomycetota bacterium]|nr:hypothetical protein [Planctomycetota bacterium]
MSTRRSARASLRSMPIGETLQEAGTISPEQLSKALKYQEQRGSLLGQILVRMGACKPEDIAAALVKQFNVTDVPLKQIGLSISTALLVGRDYCTASKLLPFEVVGNLLCLAMANPLNRKAIAKIEQDLPQYKVKTFKAPWPDIKSAIDRVFTAAENMRSKQTPAVAEEGGEPAAPAAATAKTGTPAAGVPKAANAPAAKKSAPVPVAAEEEPADDTISEALKEEPETIQTNARGLVAKPATPEEDNDHMHLPPQGQVTVDIDLDSFNAEAEAEVIGEGKPRLSRVGRAVKVEITNDIVLSKPITPDTFPDMSAHKGPATFKELLQLTANMPKAEVLAENRVVFEAMVDRGEAPTGFLKPSMGEELEVPVDDPVERVRMTPVPAEPMSAVPVNDVDPGQFNGMEEYPSHWYWRVGGAGPLVAEVAPRSEK